jgi:hypothetical protein
MGRFPRGLFPLEPRARRWAMALQAYDGDVAGASHRDVAEVLFGNRIVRTDRAGRSDYLRLQVQRLLRAARRLVNGGYRQLLAGAAADRPADRSRGKAPPDFP